MQRIKGPLTLSQVSHVFSHQLQMSCVFISFLYKKIYKIMYREKFYCGFRYSNPSSGKSIVFRSPVGMVGSNNGDMKQSKQLTSQPESKRKEQKGAKVPKISFKGIAPLQGPKCLPVAPPPSSTTRK